MSQKELKVTSARTPGKLTTKLVIGKSRPVCIETDIDGVDELAVLKHLESIKEILKEQIV